jgi:hypothetical protein
MAARIPNTATRQAPRAKSTAKPKIEFLEAYTTSLSPKRLHPANNRSVHRRHRSGIGPIRPHL